MSLLLHQTLLLSHFVLRALYHNPYQSIHIQRTSSMIIHSRTNHKLDSKAHLNNPPPPSKQTENSTPVFPLKTENQPTQNSRPKTSRSTPHYKGLSICFPECINLNGREWGYIPLSPPLWRNLIPHPPEDIPEGSIKTPPPPQRKKQAATEQRMYKPYVAPSVIQ
jgi:hypothetical protein